MSQRITFRRGTDSVRRGVIFDMGEPVFTTDTNEFFIGNGVDVGGVLAGNNGSAAHESSIFVSPASGDTIYENGSAYYLASVAAKTKRPNNQPLSENNRFTIFVYPGIYDFTQLGGIVINNARYVDTVGISNSSDTKFQNRGGYGGCVLMSGHCLIKNISFSTTGAAGVCLYVANPITGVTLENIYCSGYDVGNAIHKLNPDDDVDGLTIKNSTLIGGLFDVGGGQARSFRNSTFTNTTFNMKDTSSTSMGYGMSTDGYINNKFENCSFFFNDGYSFASDSLSPYSFGPSNTFNNCYFSGNNPSQPIFGDSDQGSIVPFSAKLYDCVFETQIGSFYGEMHDCIIDGKTAYGFTQVPLVLNNATKPVPSFYNCTILSSGNMPAVTGLNNATSGYFFRCRFNNPVATGVTGRFGNQFNVVNRWIK